MATNLVFGDKLSAFGNVIRQQMDNGVAAAGNDDGGTVMIPTQASGCSAQMSNVASATPSATCVDISPLHPASAPPTAASLADTVRLRTRPAWKTVSNGTYQGYLIDGNGLPNGADGPNSTGASDLTLPFVNGTTNAVQVIRLPPANEIITSVLGQNREANLAQIRILLADTEAQSLTQRPNGNNAQDYQLVSMLPTALSALAQGSSGGTQPQAGITVNGQSLLLRGELLCWLDRRRHRRLG